MVQSERVSMCSELSSTQEASSRVSCNHCFELNFDLSNETSDLNFAISPRSCPFAFRSVTFAVCSAGSHNCPHTHLGIICVSAPVSNNKVVPTFS